MNLSPRPLTVGRAARRTGLSPKAIRLYETRGLIEPAARTESGYRTYPEDTVGVLLFIRQARALGLRLDEIREIIDLQREGEQPCEKVLELMDARIRDIDRNMADLRTLRSTLLRARSDASASRERGDQAVVCCIIESQADAPAIIRQING